ncbi:MAG: hypothetical protein M1321_00700 [Candidatus Marsarchaeota archaeon]|nr:hypothetical protein [Candidatus Marsarchaeota archaeon]
MYNETQNTGGTAQIPAQASAQPAKRRVPSTKYIIAAMVVIGAITGGYYSYARNYGGGGGGTLYTNSTYGISIDYPTGWVALNNVTHSPGLVALFAEPQDQEGIFRSNMNILVQPNASNMTLAGYTAISDAAVVRIGGSMLSNKTITMSGHAGEEIQYTAVLNNESLEFLAAYTIANGNAYVITYTASPSQFSKYLPQVQDSISSFKLS